MTAKIKRRWVKEEKRIVSLLYRKGFLKDFKVEDLYWAEYNWRTKKTYRTRPNSYDGKRYRFPVFLPEVHYFTTDYWGEGDEHSIVSHVMEHLYWENVDTTNWDPDSGEYPKSIFNTRMTRPQFIKYLKGLPTVVPDHKINKILRTMSIDD
jgi:hypothetical protein